MKFAKEAWPFVLPFWGLSALLTASRRKNAAATSALLGGAVLLFFRDPERRVEERDDLLLAAADGLVTQVDTVEDPSVGPGRWQRIVTFLSVFDVHVQRVPTAGEVVTSKTTGGQKVAAFRPDADEVNENHLTVIRRADGDLVGIRQITGLVARRIVCYLREGDEVRHGQHLGLIKFGSRVDLFVPPRWELLVGVGDRVANGLTPMARKPNRQEP